MAHRVHRHPPRWADSTPEAENTMTESKIPELWQWSEYY